MNCPYCNSKIPSNSRFCESCGAKLDVAPQQDQSFQNQTAQNYQTTTEPYAQVNQSAPTVNVTASGNSQATTSIILGIISFVLAYIPFISFVALITGGIGMKKASNAKRLGASKGKSYTGLFINLTAVILAVSMMFLTLTTCSLDRRRGDKNTTTPAVTTTTTEATTTTEETKEDLSSLEGTYVGSNGSVIVIHENKTADYYYDGYGVSTSNAWKIENNKFYLTVNVLLFAETYADLPSGDVSVLNIKSDSIFWDDEVFTKVNNNTETPSEEECQKLVKDFKK